jgi:NAD(P)-dependent dehydrogenase (short-subunit alcohol dehydrogenase family)
MKAAHGKALEERGMGLTEDQYTSPQLIHRIVSPEEVSSLIGFLLGDESKFITKVAYEISGGFRG